MKDTPKKLALSLSGGGARAFCYFGFIRGLESEKISVDLIGAMSGAAVMLCYLANRSTDEEVIDKFSKFKYRRFYSVSLLPRGAICDYKKMIKYLEKVTGSSDISDLPYKTAIFTTDFSNPDHPQKVIYTKGNLAKVATISSIIPPFLPLHREGKKLEGDGGFATLYGASELKSMGADVVVGLFPDGFKYTKIPYIYRDSSIILKSALTLRDDCERKHDPVDLELRGFDTDAGLGDFKKAREMYEAGYKKAKEESRKIKLLLAA